MATVENPPVIKPTEGPISHNDSTVSVIIPIYNAASFIREALESVCKQTYGEYEVICVDDGSTDSSVQTVLSMSPDFKRPIQMLQQRRKGPSAARNLAASIASGRYLAFLDADDVWYPNKLDRQVAALECNDTVVLAHCNFDEIDEEGRLVGSALVTERVSISKNDWWGQLLGPQAWILPTALMVRRTAYEHIGGFDTELFFDEDADFCLRIRTLGEFMFLKEVEFAKRIHRASMTKEGESADKQFRSGEHFIRKLAIRFEHDRQKLRLVHRLLACKYSDWGWHKVRNGDGAEGFRLLSRSLRYDPARFRTYSRLLRCLYSLALRR